MLSPTSAIDSCVVVGSLLLVAVAYLCGSSHLGRRNARQHARRGIMALVALLCLGNWSLAAQEPPVASTVRFSSRPGLTASSTQTKTENQRGVSDLYRKNCVRCHGKDGKGKEARGEMQAIPDLTSHKWQGQRSDAQLMVSILDGKGKDMPAFGDKINQDAAKELVNYIRQFDAEKSQPESPTKEPASILSQPTSRIS